MKKWLVHIILLLFLSPLCHAQITPELLDSSRLRTWKHNSNNHEFSPIWTEEGIVYVLFKQKNKRDNPNRGEQVFDIMIQGDEDSSPRLYSENINSSWVEGPFAFAGNKMYLTRSNIGLSQKKISADKSLKLKIFVSHFLDGTWTKPVKVNFPEGDFNFCHPTLNQSGDMMIFASDLKGGFGKMDLYISFLRDGGWSRPQNLGPEINTKGNDWFPYLFQDQMLYFASDGYAESGDLDIYEVPYRNDAFRGAVRLPEPINSLYDDFGMSINANGETILFSSSRPGSGKDDIYICTLEQSLVKETETENVMFFIKLINEQSQAVIADKEFEIIPISLEDFGLDTFNEELILKNARNAKTTSFKIRTNALGEQTFQIDNEAKYLLIIDIDGYKESRFIYDPKVDANEWIITLETTKPTKPVTSTIIKTTSTTNTNSVIIPTTKGSKVVFENIYYEYNSDRIKSDAKGELDQLFEVLRANKNMKIQLTAHSDSRGDDQYNLDLSSRRARSAKKYLVNKGISSSRINSVGLGETQIRNHCLNGVSCSDSEHRFNRRTEVRVLEN